MFEKIVTTLEPFALTMVILAGASQSGWIQFNNSTIVGYATVFIGAALIVNHIVQQVSKQNTSTKKGK